jgi:hypothetical protein
MKKGNRREEKGEKREGMYRQGRGKMKCKIGKEG